MRYLILSACILFSFGLFAQGKYAPKGGKYGGRKSKYRTSSSVLKRNKTDVFPLDPTYALNGWSAALGLTYMAPFTEGSAEGSNQFSDGIETYQYTGKPFGNVGLYAEASYFHAFQNPKWFHFYDVGFSYRQYSGGEELSGLFSTTRPNGIGTGPVNQNSEYTDHAVSLISNLTHHYHISRYGFLQNSIGLNIDYFFSEDRDDPLELVGYEPKFHPGYQLQINYRFGFGWKVAPRILVIPSIQVPLITAYPFESGSSTIPYYMTRQYPIIVSIRVMLLRPISEDCNVPNYDGPPSME